MDEREELVALAEQLKAPMNAQAQRMKQELRDAVIPTIQRIKQVHDRIEDEGSRSSLWYAWRFADFGHLLST